MSFIFGLLIGMMFGALAIIWLAKNVCEMSYESFLEKTKDRLDKWCEDV